MLRYLCGPERCNLAQKLSFHLPKTMFWGTDLRLFDHLHVNADAVRYLISDFEGTQCSNRERISNLAHAIERDINYRLQTGSPVPDIAEMFCKHYTAQTPRVTKTTGLTNQN